ncbi:hypothetical protein HHI36_017783 [Cryptolaemus montrouzieri]|uniref:Uncharacterized protein n=1 Tax=Cryptolaemus montrouzieri TaxID=559131 RepID=A0ABD2NNI5_9CUCU
MYKKTICDATKRVVERSMLLAFEEAVELSGSTDLFVAVDGRMEKLWTCRQAPKSYNIFRNVDALKLMYQALGNPELLKKCLLGSFQKKVFEQLQQLQVGVNESVGLSNEGCYAHYLTLVEMVLDPRRNGLRGMKRRDEENTEIRKEPGSISFEG